MELLIGTKNVGKIAEYRALLAVPGLRLVTLGSRLMDMAVVESGATFEENARLKARAYADAGRLIALADDSGLCVDALGGAPGLYSARYAADEQARIDRLLVELRQVPDDRRSARFVCVIAIAEPGGDVHTFPGVCEGRIGWQPAGSNGFGYDPIFILPEFGQTMASLPVEVKNRVSHRARAVAGAREWLAGRAAGQASRL